MKRQGRHYVYHGVLDIPQAASGKFAVLHMHHDAGYRLPLATARTMLYGNPERGSVEFKAPTKWHKLVECDSPEAAKAFAETDWSSAPNTPEDGTWMTDYPIEQAQHDRELAELWGDVLVGGLGLGYAATVLARNPKVASVVVVEKERAVIDLVWPHAVKNLKKLSWRKKLRVVHADLFDYLKQQRAEWLKVGGMIHFDNAFYDIWASDGDSTWHQVVMPLLALSSTTRRHTGAEARLVENRPVCWNETVMRGAALSSFQGLAAMMLMSGGMQEGCTADDLPRLLTTNLNPKDDGPDLKPSLFHNWRVPYWKWFMGYRARVDGRVSLDLATRVAEAYILKWADRHYNPLWRGQWKSLAISMERRNG